jgi:hypothetical protein
MKDTHITEVMFRCFNKEGDIVALFPHELYNESLINSYQHVGQHSGADYNLCIACSKPATFEQCEDLKKELESIGYNLRIVKKQSRTKLMNARNEFLHKYFTNS